MSEKRRKCGTSEVNKRLLDQIPGYVFNRRSIEAHSLTWGKVRSLIKKRTANCNLASSSTCNMEFSRTKYI